VRARRRRIRAFPDSGVLIVLKCHLLIPCLLAIAFSALPAAACGCLPNPTKPCQENMTAGVVFVGHVVGVRSAGFASQLGPMRQAHAIVLEAFRGLNDREVDIYTSTSDCGINFREGRDYLVYAWRDKASGRLEAGACTQTDLVERSTENIENLRELTSGKGPARVFGFVTADPPDLQLPFRASIPLAHVPIVLRSGDQSWKTVTDDHGDYKFGGLPAGQYEIAAEMPLVAAAQRQRKFQLQAGACSGQNFLGVVVARISGRLLDSQGGPVPNVLVEIDAVPPTKQPRPIFRGFTDAQGRFSQDLLEMGEYVLGINTKSPPNARDWYGKRVPFARSFYPGVTDRVQAGVVKLQGGQNADDLEFRLPPTPSSRIIRGVVVLANGSPARALVSLVDLEYPGEKAQVDTVETDSNGGFSITGAEGRPYALLAQTEHNGRIQHSGLIDIGANVAEPWRLVLSRDDSRETCEVCASFKIWQSPLW